MGTPDYASLAALAGRRQGPADDMEALAYALLELATGKAAFCVQSAIICTKPPVQSISQACFSTALARDSQGWADLGHT